MEVDKTKGEQRDRFLYRRYDFLLDREEFLANLGQAYQAHRAMDKLRQEFSKVRENSLRLLQTVGRLEEDLNEFEKKYHRVSW